MRQSYGWLKRRGLLLFSGLVLMGCQQAERTPVTPSEIESEQLMQYGQETGCSKVMTTQEAVYQVNLLSSQWPSYPFGGRIYVEVNMQQGAGLSPGEGQMPMLLTDVAFSLSELPADVTTVAVDVKKPETQGKEPVEDQDFTTLRTVAVTKGQATIPMSYRELITFFGETHYSVWLRVIGGKNGAGIRCGAILTLSARLPKIGKFKIEKGVCFGTNPASAPGPEPVPGLIPFLEIVVSASYDGAMKMGTQDIFYFSVQEPIGGFPADEMWYDPTDVSADPVTGLVVKDNAPSLSIDTSWTSGANSFRIFSPAGSPLTGQYRAMVSNWWGNIPLACPQDPLPVTFTITTHISTQTLTCQIPCDSPGDDADIGINFPAGTIEAIVCP